MIRSIPLLMLTATPALAHTGPHLHPHGSGSWLAVVLGLAVIGGAGALRYRHSRSDTSRRRISRNRDGAGR